MYNEQIINVTDEKHQEYVFEEQSVGVERMTTASSSAARGTTVRIFLADGTPDGLRVVEKSNWTGIALMCSRVQYPDIRNRDEFDKPRVYVLIGASEENIDRQQLYIGQADI